MNSKIILIPSILFLIGIIVNGHIAGNAFGVSKNNNVNLGVEIKQTNDCDETRNGDNNSICINYSQKSIDNLVVNGQNNDFNPSIKIEQINDCDDNSEGDNTLNCSNLSQEVIP